MQYYRTFIALPVSVGEDLLHLRHEIMSSLSDERISWVDPANFHVTLRFLGDTSLGDVERITGAMATNRFSQDARAIPVKGVESFGPAKMPRVIWVAFGRDQWFRELKAEVDVWLDGLGFPSQNQVFTVHLTLGRIRSLRNVSAYHSFMNELKGRSCDEVEFDRLVYYRSILGSDGPKYSKLAEFILNKA